MPDTGSPWNIPYPASSDPPDDPSQSKTRAEKIASQLTAIQSQVTSLTSRMTAAEAKNTSQDGLLTTLDTRMDNRQLFHYITDFTFSNSAGSANKTISFPAGRFSGTPAGAGTGADLINISFRILSITASSCSMEGYRTTGAGWTGAETCTLLFGWSPSGSGGNLAAYGKPLFAQSREGEENPVELHRMMVTCHTEWCVNAELPIEVYQPTDSEVECGGCGQPITDVVAAT